MQHIDTHCHGQTNIYCLASEWVGRSETQCPTVVCVLLNWNGWRDTLVCLARLELLRYPARSLSIVVVDNGSTDGSVGEIRARFPGICLIETGQNLGFGGGVNVGIRQALAQHADFVWLLNNDTVPDPESLLAMVSKAQSCKRIGAVGSVLTHPDNPQRVQAWGGGQANKWIGTSRHALREHPDSWFDYITAASILLRRSALQDVGLFDERFFLYWEDTDLSFRLTRKGWLLAVASKSIVVHKEHGSTGQNQRRIDRFSTASGIRFLLNHSPVPWISVPLFIVLRVGKRMVAGDFRRIGDITGGLADFLISRKGSGR